MEDSTKTDEPPKVESQSEFKKPVLFGRIGKLPKKVKSDVDKPKQEDSPKSSVIVKSDSPKSALNPAVLLKELSTPIPYKVPKWSELCPDGTEYGLEVLKSGMIVENFDLTKKPYYVFGRLANCDVVLAHPTISRHHCVLQYKAFTEDGEPPSGWYLQDLGSTHGTFLNKERLKPNHYTRVRVGHQIKFGSSTRTYILLGPDFDCEGESELSVTEIKQRALNMKLERQQMIEEDRKRRESDRLEEEKRREEQGIDWGLGEDAEEEQDLTENPYASTANEELYLEDPKKTLRGYYEREGHELTYDCEERGVGQFLCRVELPIDDARGNPVRAEVIHRGKKKEAVVACALEACRILDRAGLLRQAKHESRRKKQRDWSADDFYDSDDDNYLDRTGSVEKKRQLRMRRHGGGTEAKEDKPLTYDDLLKQVAEVETKIASEEKCLERLRTAHKPDAPPDGDSDALDAFMSSLGKQGQSMAQKAEISKTKMTIQKLKTELSKKQRLAELARPAHLPPLHKHEPKMAVKVTNSVVYGKRIRLKEDSEKKPKIRKEPKREEEEFVEEMDSDEESTEQNKGRESETANNKLKSEEDSSSDKQEKIENEKIVKKNTKAPVEEVIDASDIDKDNSKADRVFGPMRPPENYVIPDSYFDQETDRDMKEIHEDE